MSELWLVRHGETDWHREGRWQGQAPQAPTLNNTGLAQMEKLAISLNGRLFSAIYCSDLLWALDSASIMAQHLGVSIVKELRLREVNLGVWEGMLGAEIPAQFSVEWAARQVDAVHARPPGGESLFEVAMRVCAAADDIARRHPNGKVLVVSHGLALAVLYCCVHGVSLTHVQAFIPATAFIRVIPWFTHE